MTHPLRWLALVALERPEMPALERMAVWHEEHFGDASQPVAAGSTDKLLTFTVGDFTAAATLVTRPIPPSQLEGPAATAWYWPEAAAALREHRAHILVTLVDEGGRAIEKAAALTRLTAAIAATAPSAGVFWGPGRLVHAPQAFIDQAVQMRADNLPLFLWVDFRIEQCGEGGVRLFTTGLEALGQNELEVRHYEGSPQELLDSAYNVAHYVLEQRKVIRDGDTIGLTERVQVTARRGASMLGGELEVLELQFENE